MTVSVDIPRATEAGRKVRFSHYRAGKIFYNTAFGEEFFVHWYNIPPTGLYREEPAINLIDAMQHFNDNHAGGN